MRKASAPQILPALYTAVVILTCAYFYNAAQPINHDTGWFMYAARGLLHGGILYQDYIDVNAPAAYWSLVPAAWLSTIPLFSTEAALTLNILIYILAGYILCVAVLRQSDLPARTQTLLLAGLLLIMCVMPHYAFGQREHIFAALFLPYVLAAGLRSENRSLPRGLAIACGISAAIGASIKPPFLIVPVFVEAAVLLRNKWKIKLTPDLLALGIATLSIYLISYLAYPIYWQEILLSAVDLYGPYNNFQFLTDALSLQLPLFVVGFAVGEYRGRGSLIGMRWMLAAATIGAFALFILQRKGWPHHTLPILLFMSSLCVSHLVNVKNILRGAITAVVIAGAFMLAFIGGNVDPNMIAGVEARVRDTDGSFYIMSTGNYPAFPLALNPAYTWTSRFPQLILLPGLIETEILGKPPSPYETEFRSDVLEDIVNKKPATIFLYKSVDAGGVDGDMMLNWFRKDPDFDLEWRTHYRWIGDNGPFAMFGRIKH